MAIVVYCYYYCYYYYYLLYFFVFFMEVISAWEKKQPITPKPGILKVQPPLAINEVENGASQDGSSQVKNMKRKKKKTGVTGEQVKDINTSIKRTQRPIYLDWTMMQTPPVRLCLQLI